MKVSGTAILNAPADKVWAALNDPAVLVRTIPGCEELAALGPDRYRMRVTAGVASIKGSYLGDVELADHVPPSAFTLRASGAGAPGTVSADVRVTLADQADGTTLLAYDADAVVGGTIGGVGQRVLGGVAKKLAGEFFTAVDGALTAPEPVAAVAVSPAAAGPAVTVPAVAVPAVAVPAVAATGPTAPAVYSRPAAAPASRPVVVDVRNQLPGAIVGALIALVGVLVGYRIARRD